MMRVLAIIPARYASKRFPAKPLALLGGMSVIERVYRQVLKSIEDVVVATDDDRIFNAVKSFGGSVVMTSIDHKSGTDRCYEAYKKVSSERGDYDVVINIQGDEPFITSKQIETLKNCFLKSVDIATLIKPYDVEDGIEALENPNSPKVVVNSEMEAIYFSRSVIPYLRGVERREWLSHHIFYKHIGIYGFRVKAIKTVINLPQSPLEIAESLEQLRWLENGFKIGVGVTNIQTIGIDTPEDLVAAEKYLNQLK